MANVLSARLRAKWETRCPDAMEHYDRIEAIGPEPGYVEDDCRYSGLVVCEACGQQLYDHPTYPFEDSLTITCDGKVVKL